MKIDIEVRYPDKKEEIIAISESGALCKRGDDILQRQSLVKQGQRILPQGEKWVKAVESNPGDALLLLSSDGRVLCLDTSELNKTSINDSEKKPGMVGPLIRAAVRVPMLTGG